MNLTTPILGNLTKIDSDLLRSFMPTAEIDLIGD